MHLGMAASRARCATVWAGVSGVAAALVGGLSPVVVEAARVAGRGDLGAAGFESLLVWGCAAAATAVTGWLWLVATLITLDAARGVLAARRGVPVALRRALLVLCGAALTSSLTAPALASGTTSTGPGARAQLLAGLRLPERVAVSPSAHHHRAQPPVAAPVAEPVAGPVAGPAAAPAAGPIAGPAAPEATVVVAPGDTLWNLAAQQLGPHPSDEETAAAWPALYALNRELIGPDPGLIEPGQRLALPPTGSDGAGR
jgi:nucleoid-associated protein YgaU